MNRDDDGKVHLCPPDFAAPEALTVWLQASAGPKRDKNRNHPDLVAADGDVDAEVERLVALGARHVDVGQTPMTRSWCWPIPRATSSAC